MIRTSPTVRQFFKRPKAKVLSSTMRFGTATLLALVVLLAQNVVANASNQPLAFATLRKSSSSSSSLSQARSQLLGRQFRVVTSHQQQRQRQRQPQRVTKGASLSMFMGSDGGILGVGGPEVFTILLVGYFVLGPSDLYKAVKEVGKFVQNFRTLGTDLTKTVESNFESQLELDEIRKAQRELNDAFSFRRTINVDDEQEAFVTKPEDRPGVESVGRVEEPAVAAASTATAGKKKKIRRRRVKKEEPAPAAVAFDDSSDGTIPDLDMSAAFNDPPAPAPPAVDEEAAKLRAERMERLQSGSQPAESPPATPVTADGEGGDDWWNPSNMPSESKADEQSRFASQLTSDWNSKIMANEDKLSPLASIMERLAILEEEKDAAELRLEEEFRLRGDLEEKYYKEKRQLLEGAAAEVQAAAYADLSSDKE